MPELTFKQLARLSVEEKNSIKELGVTEIDLTDQDKLLEAFKGLDNLTWLELDGLKSSSTSTKRTTRRQTTIKTENFTTLPANIFDDLTNLKYLLISRLKLTALDENIFIKLPKLEEIKLEYNYFSTLPANIFQNQTNLKILKIDNGYDETDTYKGLKLPANIFQPLTNLTVLELDGNNIYVLPHVIFHHLTKLKNLNLEGNNLHSLPDDIFQGLTDLDVNLDQNRLESLPKHLPFSIRITTKGQKSPMNATAATAAGGKRRTKKNQRTKKTKKTKRTNKNQQRKYKKKKSRVF
jgi:Leucine-rich repeat (LRR) protein